MARVVLEAGLKVISGRLGSLTYRHMADGSLVVARSAVADPQRQRSPAQQAQIERFRAAGVRYRLVLEDADLSNAYRHLLLRRSPLSRLRATIIADILTGPQITALDVSAYHGRPGGAIRVCAEERVALARLSLVVRDLTTGAELETGEKLFGLDELGPRAEWLYVARVSTPAGHALEISVQAYDLAGNESGAVARAENLAEDSAPALELAAQPNVRKADPDPGARRDPAVPIASPGPVPP